MKYSTCTLFNMFWRGLVHVRCLIEKFLSLTNKVTVYIFLMWCVTLLFSHRVKSGTWSSTKIQKGDTSISIQDFLSEWLKSGNIRSIKYIDSCIGAHCNPTCPDKVVFKDAGEVWREVVKAVIIALSLVITLVCFGLKASFVCYYHYLMKRQTTYLNDSETSQARKEVGKC